METSIKSKGLTSNALKLIAIAAMLIDNIACEFSFIPFYSMLGQTMRVIGRIAAPIMCFFIAEGYFHTHNMKKYALRLGIFALISYLPYIFFKYHYFLLTKDNWLDLNIFFSLLFGLLALLAWDKIENKALRILAIIVLCILSVPTDWGFFAVLFTLIFGIHHGDFKKQALWFSVVSIIMVLLGTLYSFTTNQLFCGQFFQVGIFLALPLLAMYNGERGGKKYSKWIFYIFYPTHLLILAVLAILIK